jgi:hypothetical protein
LLICPSVCFCHGHGGNSPHVIESEAKQSRSFRGSNWIASSRSLSSGARSRDPLAPRNEVDKSEYDKSLSPPTISRVICRVGQTIGISEISLPAQLADCQTGAFDPELTSAGLLLLRVSLVCNVNPGNFRFLSASSEVTR